MGTPEFSVPILKAINNNKEYNIQAVVTQPDRKVGRKKILTPPAVKEYAAGENLTVLQPEHVKNSEEMKQIIDMEPDLIVTAAYGQFLPKQLLSLPEFGAINVHASLLPKYRGAAPIHHAVMNGDSETGITIMYMEQKMDSGDIISQETVEIEEDDNTGTLFDKLSIVGSKLMLETLPRLFNNEVNPTKQEESKASYSPMISRKQEQLNWNLSAEQINNIIRALNPAPGAYTFLEGKRFKIWKASVIENQSTSRYPGTIERIDKKNFYVACGDSTVLSLEIVQPSGKGKMDVNNYLAGSQLEEGMQFE